MGRETKGGDFKLKPLIVYGATEAVEGTTPDGVVMLEFPTMEDARPGTTTLTIRHACRYA